MPCAAAHGHGHAHRNWGKEDLVREVKMTTNISLWDAVAVVKYTMHYTGTVTHVRWPSWCAARVRWALGAPGALTKVLEAVGVWVHVMHHGAGAGLSASAPRTPDTPVCPCNTWRCNTQPYMTQEVPAVFVDRRFSVLAYYVGAKPWTNDKAITYAFPPAANVYARCVRACVCVCMRVCALVLAPSWHASCLAQASRARAGAPHAPAPMLLQADRAVGRVDRPCHRLGRGRVQPW
jgi:hypothetical protein